MLKLFLCPSSLIDSRANAKGSSIVDTIDSTEALRLLWLVVRTFNTMAETPIPEDKYHSFLAKSLPQIFELFLAGMPLLNCPLAPSPRLHLTL
jgi:hypothetical protein